MTPAQCRMARAALNWSIQELVAKSEISYNTINAFELGRSVRPSTIERLQQVLEESGAEFLEDGVRLRKGE